MQLDPRKVAAITAAVNAYIRSEWTRSNRAGRSIAAWGHSSRSEMMNMRRAWQLRFMSNVARERVSFHELQVV